MNLSTARTVRELALEVPNATRVFEKLGIDYCCGGGKSLEDACGAAHIPVKEVLERLQSTAEPASEAPVDSNWSSALLADLIAHIVRKHHIYTHDEIARLQPLFEKVYSVHGKNHPELFEISQAFHGLAQELTLHMMKEEKMLFPYIERMEEAVLQKEPVLPSPFGTVENPVRMMMQEHDSAGDALRQMREVSHGYAAPDDACISYKTLYGALQEFEADLHQHIHLENNILFPRAIAMEEKHGHSGEQKTA
jgi:regulator of cell morphogenesis and NO signaling